MWKHWQEVGGLRIIFFVSFSKAIHKILEYLPPANEVWGKIIFSQAFVILSTGMKGWLPRMHHRSHDQRVWIWGGVPQGEVCLQGICLQGGCLHPGGGSAPRGSASRGGVHPGRGVCIQEVDLHPGRLCIQGSAFGGWPDPPPPKIHGILWDTVNKHKIKKLQFHVSYSQLSFNDANFVLPVCFLICNIRC